MRCVLASVSPRTRGKSAHADALAADYLGRLTGWLRVEAKIYATEKALLDGLPARMPLILLDEKGKAFDSGNFAAWLGRRRDSSAPDFTLAVGPADGWSVQARAIAAESLALSAMTWPHELAKVMAAEQLYRAWAILENHPYHRV